MLEQWKRIKKLLGEVEAKILELQTMHGVVAEPSKSWNQVLELWEDAAEHGKNVAVMKRLLKIFSLEKKTLTGLFPTAKKFRVLRISGTWKARVVEM